MRRFLAGFIALVLAAPASLFALDPVKSVFQFNHQNWTRNSGLPADKISSVTQGEDGYLWLASQNGLIRFDGQQFKGVPIALPQTRGQDVRRLARGTDGRLWLAVSDGGFGVYDKGTFAALDDPRWSKPGTDPNSILAARDGAIWTGSMFGWGRWVKGKPEESFFDEALGPVITLAEGHAGRIWIGTAERGLHYWTEGRLRAFPDDELKQRNVQCVTEDREGDLWVGTGHGLYRFDNQFRRKEVILPGSQVNTLLIDSHGVLWIGTNDSGLGRYQDGAFSFLRKADGFGSDNVTSLFEDAEGSLWVGTVEGLSQVTDLKFPIYSSTEGLVAGGAIAVAASARGGLWAVTPNGASYFDGRSAINYQDPKLFPNRYVRRVFEATNGDVYFVDGNRNLSILRPDSPPVVVPNEQWVECFAEDATGVIMGIGPSLFRMVGDKPQPYQFVGDTPLFNWFNSLLTATNGALWAGTNNGLFRFTKGVEKHWSIAQGLSSDRVHVVFEDIDGSIWCGLPTGLVRIKGDQVSSITAHDGLTDARIYAIVTDDHGYFWFASGNGLLRISRESLNAFADGRARTVQCDTFNGLEAVKFTDRTDQGYTACKTRDGRLWFPNPRGVVMIDPLNYTVNRVPPRVYVEKVRVQGHDLAHADTAKLEVGDRAVEFFFTALSFVAPARMQVRYQLEGVDAGWVNAGAARSALYNNLVPGRYTFRVQAANADGVWNLEGDAYAIELPPPFYQRLWFYASGGGILLAGFFGVYRWKVGRMQALQRELKAQNDLLETKVHQRTDELATSLSLLKATLDSTADGILAVQLKDRTLSFNRQFAEMWCLPPELGAHASEAEVTAFTATQALDSRRYLEGVQEIRAAPETEAFHLLELKDGRIFERFCKPQRVGGTCVGIVFNFRDITARRRAEATIAEASALLESLFTNSPDVMYFKDLESRFVRYSDTLTRRHGLTDRQALRGKSDFDLFPPSDARAFYENEQEIIRTGMPLIDLASRVPTADGKTTWMMTTKIPWRDTRGTIIGTFGIARDVTALKEAELRLAYERDLLNALLENTPDQIYFKDRESRFLKCSQAQALNFGATSPADLVGKRDFDFFTAEHAGPAFEDEQQIIATGRPLIGKVERETWLDGRVGWVLTSKIPLRDNTGAIIGTIGISKDITPLKQAEEKLEQVHKRLLETSRQAGMAEVATSVLHNVGNVLNSVNVSATLVADKMRRSKIGDLSRLSALLEGRAADLPTFLSADPKGKLIVPYLRSLAGELASEQKVAVTEMEALRQNVDHIKEIVARQQSYAKISGVSEAVSLAEVVDDAVQITASSPTRNQVAVVRDYQFRPTLTLERHKLMQILVNIIRNAKNACDEGGAAEKSVIVRITQQGRRVLVAVIDNGVGIPAENLTRIFAHGFTTRKEGHGFGLHSGALTARELGGSLVAHSAGVGLGATFTIELPFAEESSSPTDGV